MIGDTRQPRRQPLDAGGEEPGAPRGRIRVPPCYAARSLGHRPRIGVDAEDERLRIRQHLGQDGAAVAGPEIDDDPAMPPGQVEDLADVDLGDAPAGDGMHPGSMPQRPARADDVRRGPAY
jgi:hypothetical protein